MFLGINLDNVFIREKDNEKIAVFSFKHINTFSRKDY